MRFGICPLTHSFQIILSATFQPRFNSAPRTGKSLSRQPSHWPALSRLALPCLACISPNTLVSAPKVVARHGLVSTKLIITLPTSTSFPHDSVPQGIVAKFLHLRTVPLSAAVELSSPAKPHRSSVSKWRLPAIIP